MSKYQRWYDQIISRGRARRDLGGYSEVHHILPRSLGGDDGDRNLVELSYREHFLAHWLLTKIYDGEARRAMIYALHCMSMTLSGRLVAGWQIEVAKRAVKDEVLRSRAFRRDRWSAKLQKAMMHAEAEMELAKSPPATLTIARDRELVGSLANAILANRPKRLRTEAPKNLQSLYSVAVKRRAPKAISRGDKAFGHGRPRKRTTRVGHLNLRQQYKG